jgi:hypothetical protein
MPHDRDVARLAVGIAVQHTVLQLFVDLCRRELRILRDLSIRRYLHSHSACDRLCQFFIFYLLSHLPQEPSGGR